MSRRFNFTQCINLLHTNSKTFLKWLAEDGIDASKQIDRADPRQKYVTEEQLISMAKKRDIELHLPDDRKPESSATRILAAVNERFAALEQQISTRLDEIEERFDRVEAQLQTAIATMANLQHDLHDLMALMKSEPEVTPLREQVKASLKITPTRTTARKPAKRKVKSKGLPKNLVPLSAFKIEHKVSDKAVEYAIEKGKITVERGKWTHNNRNVMIALNQQGRHEFYELFYERPGFHRCDYCPHAL